MAKTFEYVPFTRDVDANRAVLGAGLTSRKPVAVGAEIKGELFREVNQYCPEGCYVGRAEIYGDDELNVFIKVAPAVPAVGIVRVRKNHTVAIDMAQLLTWADVSGDGDDFDSALGLYIDDVENRLGLRLNVPDDLGALRTEFDIKYKQNHPS